MLGASILKEQDKLVHLLTEDRGILRAIAPGALKNRNRFGALLELFTEGEYQYYWKEDKEMITISKGDIVSSHFSGVSDSKNIFYFYLIAEVLQRFVPYDHRDKRIYRLVRATLESCDNGIHMPGLLLYFLIWILRIEGMMFNPAVCQNCFEKDPLNAWMRTDFRGILCPQCRTDENLTLNQNDLLFLKWTEKKPPAQMNQWTDLIETPKLIRLFKQKIEHHGELNLKTAQYLAEFR